MLQDHPDQDDMTPEVYKAESENDTKSKKFPKKPKAQRWDDYNKAVYGSMTDDEGLRVLKSAFAPTSAVDNGLLRPPKPILPHRIMEYAPERLRADRRLVWDCLNVFHVCGVVNVLHRPDDVLPDHELADKQLAWAYMNEFALEGGARPWHLNVLDLDLLAADTKFVAATKLFLPDAFQMLCSPDYGGKWSRGANWTRGRAF